METTNETANWLASILNILVSGILTDAITIEEAAKKLEGFGMSYRQSIEYITIGLVAAEHNQNG